MLKHKLIIGNDSAFDKNIISALAEKNAYLGKKTVVFVNADVHKKRLEAFPASCKGKIVTTELDKFDPEKIVNDSIVVVKVDVVDDTTPPDSLISASIATLRTQNEILVLFEDIPLRSSEVVSEEVAERAIKQKNQIIIRSRSDQQKPVSAQLYWDMYSSAAQ